MPADAPKLTPMMQQYFEVKRGLPKDTLLLFRLGDFFELFFEDAVVASKILGLTLTKRQDHAMAGLPSVALDNYVTKLLAAGKKVAICDQAEPAQPGKLVRRALTRILSPGTTLNAAQLDAARNHYLCALAFDAAGLHAAWLDLSTGEFRVATDPAIANLLPVLTALDPAELLVIDPRHRPGIGIGRRIADQDVDLAEGGIGLIDQPLQVVLRGDVGRNGDRPALAVFRIDRRSHLITRPGLARTDHHPRAVLGHPLGNRLADPPRGTRDDGDLAGQIEQFHR